MSLYAKIVPKEKIDVEGGVSYIRESDADVYTGLYSIKRPANSGHLDWTEEIELEYMDGTTETVRGHFLSSGGEDE